MSWEAAGPRPSRRLRQRRRAVNDPIGGWVHVTAPCWLALTHAVRHRTAQGESAARRRKRTQRLQIVHRDIRQYCAEIRDIGASPMAQAFSSLIHNRSTPPQSLRTPRLRSLIPCLCKRRRRKHGSQRSHTIHGLKIIFDKRPYLRRPQGGGAGRGRRCRHDLTEIDGRSDPCKDRTPLSAEEVCTPRDHSEAHQARVTLPVPFLTEP